jgi:hypothetical protein
MRSEQRRENTRPRVQKDSFCEHGGATVRSCTLWKTTKCVVCVAGKALLCNGSFWEVIYKTLGNSNERS